MEALAASIVGRRRPEVNAVPEEARELLRSSELAPADGPWTLARPVFRDDPCEGSGEKTVP
jgi:hypothetical protein